MKVSYDEPLSKHTSYKTGGKAKYFIEPYNTNELIESFKLASDKKLFILGNGSNVLFSDDFFDGVVICLKNLNKYALIAGNKLVCGSGCLLNDIVNFAIYNNLGGIESLAGIPGTVGGAVFMNAGAFGTELKDILYDVKVVDFSGKLSVIKREEINFSYRSSGLDNQIVVEATFCLEIPANESIKYDILTRRDSKQPLEYPSCGSVFKRPKDNYAGALIEKCNLKGYKIGGAMVSEKHANFIINIGGATSSDIFNLINFIKRTVYEQTGVLLEEEVKLVNFKSS